MKVQYLNDILEKVNNAMGIDSGEGIQRTGTYIMGGVAVVTGIVIVFTLRILKDKFKWA
jgi:hypothetical protein